MNTIITIAREFGSGGRYVAQQLAQKLDIPFLDKQLIALAAQETGLSPEFIENTEERQKTTSLLYNLYFSTQNLPLSDQVFIAQSNILKQKAEQGPCVIVGRCADYVLRNFPNVLNVFIYAPIEARILRVQDVYKEKARDMHAYVRKQDKSRAAYYNHFTTEEWGQAHNYDVCMNSELGVDIIVRCLGDIIEEKEASR